MTTAPTEELGEEREVDLRSLRDRLAARWWLVAAGLVLGAVVGVLVATGGGKVYDAKSILYLGEPFASGQQVRTLATNPRTVTAIVKSEATLQRVSGKSGVSVDKLRGSVSVGAVTAVGQSAGLGRSTPLIEITVQLKQARQAEAASNEFARVVVDGVSGYVRGKIALIERSLAETKASRATSATRIEGALEQQKLAVRSTELSLADRLIVQANANTTLQFYEARLENLRRDLRESEQNLSLAKNIELSRIVEPAVAAPTSARNRRNSAVVGGIIGLILGGLGAAIVPVRPRRRKQPARA